MPEILKEIIAIIIIIASSQANIRNTFFVQKSSQHREDKWVFRKVTHTHTDSGPIQCKSFKDIK